jgi:hypothetical protein
MAAELDPQLLPHRFVLACLWCRGVSESDDGLAGSFSTPYWPLCSSRSAWQPTLLARLIGLIIAGLATRAGPHAAGHWVGGLITWAAQVRAQVDHPCARAPSRRRPAGWSGRNRLVRGAAAG